MSYLRSNGLSSELQSRIKAASLNCLDSKVQSEEPKSPIGVDSSQVLEGGNEITSKVKKVVKFNDKLKVIFIPTIKEYKKEGIKEDLWLHPKEYVRSKKEIREEYDRQLEKLTSQGRGIPESCKNVRAEYNSTHLILGTIYQPNSTKPHIPLQEID